MSSAPIGFPKSLAEPSLTGRSPVSIFMVVVLPEPLEPRKPKISPRAMRKTHVVDGDEIAKAAGQAIRFDRRGLVSADGARTHDDFLMLGALFRWKKGNEGVIERGLLRFGEDLLRRATRDDLAVVHGGKPIEAAGLVHISRRDDHA